MWFQHDGAHAHFSADVRSALDTTYPGRWIGRGGPVNWPTLSFDLSCLDFFLCGYMTDSKSPINSNLGSIKVFKGAILFLEATDDVRISLSDEMSHGDKLLFHMSFCWNQKKR
ncbi:uncharacterized protein TNCV_284511 [Trichonephila clavipes]|uniref:Transposase n=1 Tax=Trichonephila clavipes TaxID=2585209 RepID=A0A8X6SSV1_TRICX|nr:uncharacterized protein TNCV_284511 [Trichonephila clavipes]